MDAPGLPSIPPTTAAAAARGGPAGPLSASPPPGPDAWPARPSLDGAAAPTSTLPTAATGSADPGTSASPWEEGQQRLGSGGGGGPHARDHHHHQPTPGSWPASVDAEDADDGAPSPFGGPVSEAEVAVLRARNAALRTDLAVAASVAAAAAADARSLGAALAALAPHKGALGLAPPPGTAGTCPGAAACGGACGGGGAHGTAGASPTELVQAEAVAAAALAVNGGNAAAALVDLLTLAARRMQGTEA